MRFLLGCGVEQEQEHGAVGATVFHSEKERSQSMEIVCTPL